ncbi:MAG: heparinase [Planctomycetes bacterium]|nr:heparinase [Planctomycetota bacterium]
MLKEPIPELTDELYLDFSRTGNRSRCQRVMAARHRRVSVLVMAECLENRGRFLPAIEEALRAVCSEKTWVMPAHDRRLRNFRGEVNEIDLQVAGLSWELATVLSWLGDRLSQDVRTLVSSELERRTFRPLEHAVRTGQPRLWWLTGTNNWNAVCLAGTTGAALATIESTERRAFFVAAAEKAIRNFLSGFTPDGYCSEGIGYWNYGFGHFVLLAETLFQATQGKLDLLQLDPKIKSVALYGHRMEITPGVYPAFADCHVGAEPAAWIMGWLSRRLGLGLREVEKRGLALDWKRSYPLFAVGLMGFPNSASRHPSAASGADRHALRDWFPVAGVLICRLSAGKTPFGVAMKGGHNAEHHNHNDVGSFVVAVGGHAPLVDPGSEVYTRRTFSSRRYESKVLNSFGHPVPVVAGRLQRSGRSAAAKVLRAEFTDAADTLVLDLRAAYPVSGLKILQRTFICSRQDGGRLTVVDQVAFTTKQTFGTALITFEKWRQTDSKKLLIGEGSDAVSVEIDAGGVPFRVHGEMIDEDLSDGRKPTRIGIDCVAPVQAATIRLTIRPARL